MAQKDVSGCTRGQNQALARIHGGHLVKLRPFAYIIHRDIVDLGDVKEVAEAVCVTRGAGLPLDIVAGAQMKAANLRIGYIYIILARQQAVGAEKAVSLRLRL